MKIEDVARARPYVSHTTPVIERRIHTPLPPVTPAASIKTPVSRMRNMRSLFVTVCIVLLTIAGGLYYFRSSGPEFPAAITQKINFSLYLPQDLPEGFKIDESSYSSEGGAVLFTITDSSKRTIVITQQPKPPQMDLKEFNKNEIRNGVEFDTTVGQATIGTLGSNLATSIITDGSWIIISEPAPGNASNLKQTARSLELAE